MLADVSNCDVKSSSGGNTLISIYDTMIRSETHTDMDIGPAMIDVL